MTTRMNKEQGGEGLSKSGKELKKLLRRTAGQNGSDDEDTDEDESPSPVLAPKQEDQLKSEPGENNLAELRAPGHARSTPPVSPVLAAKQEDQLKSEPGENNLAEPRAPGHARSTPPVSKSNQKRRSGGDDAKTPNGAVPKKPKIEHETTLVVKEETPPSLEPTSKALASATSDTDVSPVTEEEIRRVLLAVAPVTTQDLVSRFKPRIRTQEDKKDFTAILKKISHILKTNGRNYIVLREEYK